MKSLRPVRENCFGWWLADLDERVPWSPRIRPVRQTTHDVGHSTLDQNQADKLRLKQLISRTTVPTCEELLELVQSGRLPHLEKHQSVIERVLGPEVKDEEPPEEESLSTSTPSTPSPVEIDDLRKLEDAVKVGHVHEDLARQVTRLRELSANLTELRFSSRELLRDLKVNQ